MERNRVLITGLPKGSKISRTDLIMYFQSNKKSGGGEVIDAKYLDQGDFIITYQNEVVANNVLAREHVINGHAIHTTVPSSNERTKTQPWSTGDIDDDPTSDENENETGDPEELCTVQVENLSHRTTKDSIQNYFENKNRSKGGVVRKVELQNTLNAAIVVFRNYEDAMRVAGYTKHKLDDARLSVDLVIPKEDKETLHKGKKKTFSDAPSDEALPLEFVVSGISELTTEDALINYLENTRRSGGGEVEDLSFDEVERVAEVKFRNVRSLERLLGNQHRIDDNNLKIEVKEPEKEIPLDPFRVHVKGLSSKTTTNGLELYMEKMSNGSEVKHVERGSYDNALILFKEPIDFKELALRVENDKRGLEGCKPILESVPYCCCIQVSGLDDKTTKNSLELYFDNERKGCGVEPLEVDLQGQGRALVYFDDPSVIDKALSKRHVLENAELQMEMFYPFLSEEKATKKRHKKKNKTEEIDIDPDIMACIESCYSDELQDLLDEAGIDLEWTTEKESAVMTEKEEATNKSEPWGKRIKCLQEYFGDFKCQRISVEAKVWGEVLEAIKKELTSMDEFSDTHITTHESANEIRITGKKDCLQMAVSAVETLVRGIQDDKALQDSIETKVEKDLESGKLALLKISDLFQVIQASNKHVEMQVKENDGEVIIKGPRKCLQEISIELYKFFSKVKEEILELPERIIGVLQTPKGRDYVCKSLSQNQIQAVLVHGQRKGKNEASIFAINKDQARQAMKLIESFSTERSIHFKDENIPVIQSRKWNELIASFQEAQTVVNIFFEEQCQTLWISGVEQDALECFTIVQSYIEKNTILEDNVAVSDGCSRFLFQRFDNEIKGLHAELRDAFVKIQPGDCGEIRLIGTREGIEKSKEFVMSLVQEVCDEQIKIDKPGMKKFFKSSKGAKVIKAIEAENKCTVELVDLDQLEEQGASSSKGMGGSKRVVNGEEICSYTTIERKKLVVYKDDLTKHPVDVIVNAANEELQHVGGLALDIVRVGGQGIQGECNRYINAHGPLIEGHVLETGPGLLPCKRIIHAVGPRWDSIRDQGNSGSRRKKNILRFTFENCLESAKNYRSIAIPAVSAGIFGFPVDLCASILVETVITFFQKNPHCNLSEVHFTNIDDMTVKAFFDEMKRQFGKERTFNEGMAKPMTSLSSNRYQESKSTSTSFPASSSGKVLTTSEGISIFVNNGDISQEKVRTRNPKYICM